ncbi:hypothetical protein [Streptomyces sp. TRM70350]|uniref:hypothetical protein n=1 Tax=Streptomyces sp. TRM70350 TaxID=2856165 RepID=UPI002110DA1E|nr:hypothetical protein [Streptomyces sp. TRM70350]
MSLWSIAGTPLLAGNNVATMTTETRDILTNPEVLAINQDPRGLQGVKVAEDTRGLQVYGKVLSGTGKRAVMLFNRTGSAANITVRWADLGLTTASAAVRNAWTRADAGSFATGCTTSVRANDAILLTVSGAEASGSTYENTTATTPTFSNVTASAAGTKLVDITYANGGTTARRATIQVSGQFTGGGSAMTLRCTQTQRSTATATPRPKRERARRSAPAPERCLVRRSGRCGWRRPRRGPVPRHGTRVGRAASARNRGVAPASLAPDTAPPRPPSRSRRPPPTGSPRTGRVSQRGTRTQVRRSAR